MIEPKALQLRPSESFIPNDLNDMHSAGSDLTTFLAQLRLFACRASLLPTLHLCLT